MWSQLNVVSKEEFETYLAESKKGEQ